MEYLASSAASEKMENQTGSLSFLKFEKLLLQARQDCRGDITEVPTQCCFCCDSLPSFSEEVGLISEWCQVGCLKHLNFTCQDLHDPFNPNNEDNQRYCGYGASFVSLEPIVHESNVLSCSNVGEIVVADIDDDGGESEGEGEDEDDVTNLETGNNVKLIMLSLSLLLIGFTLIVFVATVMRKLKTRRDSEIKEQRSKGGDEMRTAAEEIKGSDVQVQHEKKRVRFAISSKVGIPRLRMTSLTARFKNTEQQKGSTELVTPEHHGTFLNEEEQLSATNLDQAPELEGHMDLVVSAIDKEI